jgi:hypothetical protein
VLTQFHSVRKQQVASGDNPSVSDTLMVMESASAGRNQ